MTTNSLPQPNPSSQPQIDLPLTCYQTTTVTMSGEPDDTDMLMSVNELGELYDSARTSPVPAEEQPAPSMTPSNVDGTTDKLPGPKRRKLNPPPGPEPSTRQLRPRDGTSGRTPLPSSAPPKPDPKKDTGKKGSTPSPTPNSSQAGGGSSKSSKGRAPKPKNPAKASSAAATNAPTPPAGPGDLGPVTPKQSQPEPTPATPQPAASTELNVPTVNFGATSQLPRPLPALTNGFSQHDEQLALATLPPNPFESNDQQLVASANTKAGSPCSGTKPGNPKAQKNTVTIADDDNDTDSSGTPDPLKRVPSPPTPETWKRIRREQKTREQKERSEKAAREKAAREKAAAAKEKAALAEAAAELEADRRHDESDEGNNADGNDANGNDPDDEENNNDNDEGNNDPPASPESEATPTPRRTRRLSAKALESAQSASELVADLKILASRRPTFEDPHFKSKCVPPNNTKNALSGCGFTRGKNVKPAPFTKDGAKPLNATKLKVNKTFEEGVPRQNVCLPCLAALNSYDPTFPLGRGVKSNVEVCSCYVHASYGNKGRQCGRCQLLAKKISDCIDPPAELIPAVQEFIPWVYKFNASYVKSPGMTWENMSAEERKFAKAFQAKAKNFYSRWMACRRDDDYVTPQKQTASTMMATIVRGFEDITQQLTDVRNDVAQIEKRMEKQEVRDRYHGESIQDTLRITRQTRARVDHLTASVGQLGGHLPQNDEGDMYELEPFNVWEAEVHSEPEASDDFAQGDNLMFSKPPLIDASAHPPQPETACNLLPIQVQAYYQAPDPAGAQLRESSVLLAFIFVLPVPGSFVLGAESVVDASRAATGLVPIWYVTIYPLHLAWNTNFVHGTWKLRLAAWSLGIEGLDRAIASLHPSAKAQTAPKLTGMELGPDRNHYTSRSLFGGACTASGSSEHSRLNSEAFVYTTTCQGRLGLGNKPGQCHRGSRLAPCCHQVSDDANDQVAWSQMHTGWKGLNVGGALGYARIPEKYHTEAKAVVATINAYNQCLQRNAAIAPTAFTDADKGIMKVTIDLAKALCRKLMAWKRNSQSKDKQKQQAGDEPPWAELLVGIRDTRRDIADLRLQGLRRDGAIDKVQDGIRKTHRVTRQNRARQRWAMESLIEIAKNLDPPVTIKPLSLQTAQDLSDGEMTEFEEDQGVQANDAT
ncbi:hypothetical protein V492_02029 [Pseudogymnoascus sp. VKM F-4246]|nr:hypothetical protein V492_02029 [Pseudogymnoascus sp. VKM F-4246]